jgi:hypothetical protein
VLITDLLPAVIALAVLSGVLLIIIVVMTLCWVLKNRNKPRELPTAKRSEEENNYQAIEVCILSSFTFFQVG